MLTQVADGVYSHQSELLLNNTAVVRGRDGVVVVDAGITNGEMACLANDLAEWGLPVVAGFATHPDWDHVLWHATLGSAPRYGTERCASFMRDVRSKEDWRATVAEGLPPEIIDDTPLDLFGVLTPLPSARIPWEGPEIRVVEHPAHAPGHAALLIEDRGVLIAGDMLSDLFVPMPDLSTADPLGDYLTGLRLLEEAGQVDVVIPGHGSPATTADEVRRRFTLDRAYILSMRDGLPFDDPRVGAATPGFEWVDDIHEGQLHTFTSTRESHIQNR